ncbi:hypothetical protein TNCV_66811 [Trichonephila clavipes]|nr:hypothetical protein TNCV_66811 [Trichonephila clavipes]
MLKHLRFDIFEQQEMKLPVRLINITNERRQVQGHETPLRMKGETEKVSTKGSAAFHSRREPISEESPTSFPEYTAMNYSGFEPEPTCLQVECHNHHTRCGYCFFRLSPNCKCGDDVS